MFQKKGLSFTLDWTAQALVGMPSIARGGGGGTPGGRGGGGGGLLPEVDLVSPKSTEPPGSSEAFENKQEKKTLHVIFI